MLALDAGAELVDLEFILMLGHAMLHPEAVRGMLFTFQYLLPKGARGPFNNEGEPFLANYDPEGSDNPARHIYARAIFGEVRAGRGTRMAGCGSTPDRYRLKYFRIRCRPRPSICNPSAWMFRNRSRSASRRITCAGASVST